MTVCRVPLLITHFHTLLSTIHCNIILRSQNICFRTTKGNYSVEQDKHVQNCTNYCCYK